jgi:hypothetical protein
MFGQFRVSAERVTGLNGYTAISKSLRIYRNVAFVVTGKYSTSFKI